MNKRQHAKIVADVKNMIGLSAYNIAVALRAHMSPAAANWVADLCHFALRDALSWKRPTGLVVDESWGDFSTVCAYNMVDEFAVKCLYHDHDGECAQHLCPRLACNQVGTK